MLVVSSRDPVAKADLLSVDGFLMEGEHVGVSFTVSELM